MTPDKGAPADNTDAVAGTSEDTKARVRYSGAARRRYKKQLLLEGKGEGPLPGAVKRTRKEAHTPSPGESHPGKRPKVADQESYAQVTKGILKVAVIPAGYPETKLGTNDTLLIRKLIRERILSDRLNRAPSFTGSWERDGAMVFACQDEMSRDWLANAIALFKIGSTSLRVVPTEELPGRHRVVIHAEEPEATAKEIVDLLARQNEGLATKDWIVVRASESRDAKSTHFACLVDDRSLEALKNLGLRPFCGTGRASVKLLDKDRRMENKETSTKEAA